MDGLLRIVGSTMYMNIYLSYTSKKSPLIGKFSEAVLHILYFLKKNLRVDFIAD